MLRSDTAPPFPRSRWRAERGCARHRDPEAAEAVSGRGVQRPLSAERARGAPGATQIMKLLLYFLKVWSRTKSSREFFANHL
ncbi:hypothetical protein AV530_007578 [Patagioenas fasciata monilis]|uniref:Uncharacterized protein n=1 Tax=Patagioenas fasciata monilis TaxID=372326 RepID=A0A1V4JYA3_PATFA|nr:hypothetical protein AV530_007578 [Patagioenas fasciata monilis]